MNLPLILVLLSAASDGGTAAVSLHGPLPAVYVAQAELVVARCDEGRCPPPGADVCDRASPDPDRHVLRALELATGNEAWSDERFPTPVGSLNQGGRVIALVAMNMTLTGAVVRDARTGAELATCSVAAEPAGFSGAWADKGTLLVSGFNLGMSGIPRPRPPVRQLKASPTSCTLTLRPSAPELEGPAPVVERPQPGVRLTEGRSQTAGWIEVRVGSRERRVVTQTFRTGCSLARQCPQVP